MYLGKLSFETYAIHWPLMLVVEAALFICFRKNLGYHASALLAFVITLFVIYIASILLNLFVKSSGKLLKKGMKRLRKEKESGQLEGTNY